MSDICSDLGNQYREMAVEQDVIGWQRFMEGIISKQLVCIQADYRAHTGEGIMAMAWASQLVVRLLEVTHSQWIY